MPDNGGTAFPTNSGFHGEDGMTLRDYFAAKALAALIGKEDKDYHNRGPSAVPKLATWAYEYADALLQARDIDLNKGAAS